MESKLSRALAPKRPDAPTLTSRQLVKAWWQALRPPFFIVDLIPVGLGGALAARDLGYWPWGIFAVVMVRCFCLHTVANIANDLFDYLEGVDTDETIGGTKVIQNGWISPRQICLTIIGLLLSTVLIGWWLIGHSGQEWLWGPVVFAVLSAVFGFASINSVFGNLWMLPDIAWYLEELVPIFCFFGAGLGCLWGGLRRQKRVRTFRSYLAMIGSRTTISISALSSTLGTSPAKVRDTLEDMLDDGFFPLGYLDYGSDRLVLTSDGIPDPPKEEEKPAQEEPAEDPQNAILEEIRAINADIDNPKLNQQIDRIGVITAKVFEYQRSHPQKSNQLHSFLSYYLPTTLKILRAYAQLEDQEVSGENITSAMARIEGMMDKVVEGFEKQLDQLFQGDALDITADVEVLERMLAKDGLSSGSTLRMGG